MRRAGLSIAVLAALPATLSAQEARLRSGEHADFSRLVIYMPQAAEIETQAGDRTFALEFDAGFGFDTSDVFYYIPRTRITDVAAEPGRLVLDLACDCPVSVERLSPQVVYLDVGEPADGRGTAAREPIEVDDPSPLIRLPIRPEPAAATLLPGGLRATSAGGVADAPSARDMPPSGTAATVARQIARAATQGLLEPESILPEPPDEVPAYPPAVEVQGQDAPSRDPAPREHVSIRNGIDESLGRDLAGALKLVGPLGHCLPDESLDVGAWAPDGADSISRLRAAVVGPTDRPDPAGIADLARGYIALTFGVEAQQAIRGAGVAVPDAGTLLAMAEIVDHGHATRPGPLADQYDCRGASALWAVLARPTIPDAAELDADALTLAFSALPAQMRMHLGPTLAERLIVYGATDAAAVVRNAILRAPGDATVETALLEASLAAKAGQDAAADEALTEIVEATSGRSAAAVERLMQRRLDAGEPVSGDALAAADALIFEHRGTALAQRLSVLKIEALARGGQAERALAFLADAARGLPEDAVARLRGISYAEAAAQLDDPDFLLVAVGAAGALHGTPEEMAARRAVARRLVQMELFGLAGTLDVEEGRTAGTQTASAAPVPVPVLPLAAAEDLPGEDRTLERSAALLERSADLRQRLNAALAGGESGE